MARIQFKPELATSSMGRKLADSEMDVRGSGGIGIRPAGYHYFFKQQPCYQSGECGIHLE